MIINEMTITEFNEVNKLTRPEPPTLNPPLLHQQLSISFSTTHARIPITTTTLHLCCSNNHAAFPPLDTINNGKLLITT